MTNTLTVAVCFLLVGTSFGQYFQATPITDLASGYYLGQFQGGLYENGTNVLPSDHQADHDQFAGQIGQHGTFVFLGIGMSVALLDFKQFVTEVKTTKGLNPSMVVIDGAQGSQEACSWAYATGTPHDNGCPVGGGWQSTVNPYDVVLNSVLSPPKCGQKGYHPCYAENQVEVVWLDDADSCRLGVKCYGLPAANADAYTFERYVGMIARAARIRYPNLKLMYLSSRIYAGYATVNINPEPYAYETGFSDKWIVQAQINQVRTGIIDPVAGDLNYSIAPWVGWGPYAWAAGDTPRSDGLIWCWAQPAPSLCNGEQDYQTDGTHPDPVGQSKYASLLLQFAEQEPWFVTH